MTELRCISLHDPWGTACAVGLKTIETRGWYTPYRGRFGIHVAKKRISHCAKVGAIDCYRQDTDRLLVHGVKSSLGSFDPAEKGTWIDVPYGRIVATANLVDCVPMVAAGHATRAEVEDRRRTGMVVFDADAEKVAYYHSGFRPYELSVDVSDQWPYGDFGPGRCAWILDDIKPTTERCPACWTPRDPGGFGCSTCMDYSGSFASSCEPIPVVGRQGWWTVELDS